MLVCRNCGWKGDKGKKNTKGSIGMELILWLFFIVPGLIYSIWRLSSKEIICPSCKAPALIPADSPIGREIMAKYAPGLEQPQTEKTRSSDTGFM